MQSVFIHNSLAMYLDMHVILHPLEGATVPLLPTALRFCVIDQEKQNKGKSAKCRTQKKDLLVFLVVQQVQFPLASLGDPVVGTQTNTE